MSSKADIEVRLLSWDHPDSVHLRHLQRVEIISLGGLEPGLPPTAANVPVFLIAYKSGVPVGCGGLRPLSNDTAEIKRMFVDEAYRGRAGRDKDTGNSVAELILEALEAEARKRAWSVLLLETGTFLTKARRFYERCGFIECEMFGDYKETDNSVCYRKYVDN